MEKITCLSCYHWAVCKVTDKARQEEVWNKDAEKFFQDSAEFCDYYEPERKEVRNGTKRPLPRVH